MPQEYNKDILKGFWGSRTNRQKKRLLEMYDSDGDGKFTPDESLAIYQKLTETRQMEAQDRGTEWGGMEDYASRKGWISAHVPDENWEKHTVPDTFHGDPTLNPDTPLVYTTNPTGHPSVHLDPEPSEPVALPLPVEDGGNEYKTLEQLAYDTESEGMKRELMGPSDRNAWDPRYVPEYADDRGPATGGRKRKLPFPARVQGGTEYLDEDLLRPVPGIQRQGGG